MLKSSSGLHLTLSGGFTRQANRGKPPRNIPSRDKARSIARANVLIGGQSILEMLVSYMLLCRLRQ